MSTQPTRINPARLLADLRELARFGACGTGVDRVSYSSADIEARQWLANRMREAGLDAHIDRVGNVAGCTPGVSRAVVIGSHTDTVPRGGWLDGAMGVICGLEIARARIEQGKTTGLGVDVGSFQDEEGTYLSCLGSRSFCGDLPEAELTAARRPDGGEALVEAIARAGYGGSAWTHDPARHAAYLEVHIEQGPQLEAHNRRLGVVTGIVGIRRWRIHCRGQADHAGTTPMSMRRDAARALIGIAHWVHAEVPRLAAAETVWNIGVMSVAPGAANVVPAEASMVVEFRDTDLTVLDRIEAGLLAAVARADGPGGVNARAESIARSLPTLMDERLVSACDDVARALEAPSMRMVSGAGHDAMIIGRVLPSAMLFVPSIDGRSHDIVENTADADIVLGCQALAALVDRVETITP
jgi:N-carbamoyl-L-amino-acid hydrolase